MARENYAPTSLTVRRAEIHEVPDCVKHPCWVGKPLFVVAIMEGRRILDTYEADSLAEGAVWAQEHYRLDPADTSRR